MVEMHPVQAPTGRLRASAEITARAYEVYSHVYGPQEALRRGERGGFSVGELIGFLYARAFPKDEWRARVKEAFSGIEGG